MKDQNLKIKEDWERESLKDFVYLYEEQQLIREGVIKEINKREPAQIVVIDKQNILDKQHEHQHQPLPF